MNRNLQKCISIGKIEENVNKAFRLHWQVTVFITCNKFVAFLKQVQTT